MLRLYIAGEGGPVVVTRRQGSWQASGPPQVPSASCLAVGPAWPETVFCGTPRHGVWRSDDAGESWRKIFEPASDERVTALALDPRTSSSEPVAVYVGTEPSVIYRSDDGGGVWNPCDGLNDLPSAAEWSFPPRPETHHVRWIHPDLHHPHRLFVAVEAGALIRSSDRGESWQDRVPGAPRDTHQLATHPSAPGRLYSAAGDGYFESTDGGQSWQRLEDGLQHRYVWSIAVDAADAENRIIASAASPRRSHDASNAESFLYRRTAGSAWHLIRSDAWQPSGRRTAVLAAHPGQPGTFFALWENDVFCSIDGGAHWQRLEIRWPEGYLVGEPRRLIVADAN